MRKPIPGPPWDCHFKARRSEVPCRDNFNRLSGPETAEDSRTHFGIFSPAVTQLFPMGQIINLHPWEPNEVAPCMAAALQTDAPIVALHLTRPAVEVPDRAALGMASHMDAAKGAYVIRPFDESRPREGTLIVEGTTTMESIMELLPQFQSDKTMPNVKLVCATSFELFELQSKKYRDGILHKSEWLDSTVISNGCKIGMHPWLASKIAEGYAMTADHDNRWRVSGSVAEVKKDAKIDSVSLEEGIRRFAGDRSKRLAAPEAPFGWQLPTIHPMLAPALHLDSPHSPETARLEFLSTNGKSKFPMTWSGSKIMHAASDVVTSNRWMQTGGRAGAQFTRRGHRVRYKVIGEFEGVTMEVITDGVDIITAFPPRR